MSNFSKSLHILMSNLPAALDAAVHEVTMEVQTRAQASTLFKDGTGNLRSSICILKSGDLARTVLADKDYAFYVEMGNDPGGGYIYPRGKALRFQASGGNVVFTKRVRAHGPLPFMGNAENATQPLIEGIVSKHLASLWA